MKKARKAKRRETYDKNRREAEKVGLPVPESPETSVSEIEGGEELHWLNELADEEDEDEGIPPLVGEPRSQRGRGTKGGSEAPEGSHVLGGVRVAPYIIVDDVEDGAPQEGSVPPGPQEGERASGGGLEAPQETVALEGTTEPHPAAGVEVGRSAEASRSETTVGAPVPSVGETGARPTTPSALEGT